MDFLSIKQIGGGIAAGLGVLGAGFAAYKHHEHKQEAVRSYFRSTNDITLMFYHSNKVSKRGSALLELAEANRPEGLRPGSLMKERTFLTMPSRRGRNMTGLCIFVAHSKT